MSPNEPGVNPVQPEAILPPIPAGAGGELPQAGGEGGQPAQTPKPTPEPSESPVLLDPLARTALQMAQTNAETLFDGIGGVPRPLSSLYLNQDLGTGGGFQRGNLIIDPTLSLGANYRHSSGRLVGDNQTEAYGLLSPAFDLSLGEPATGRIINIGYIGSLILGDKGDRQSQYDQSLAVRGVLAFEKLSFGFGLQFSQLSGPTRDTGGQDIGQVLLGISFTANYELTAKTNLETDVTAPIRLFSGNGVSSEGVSDTTFINYAYSPLTTISLGAAGGVLTVENSRTQTFEQILSRFTYLGGAQLVYNGTFGVEFRDTGFDESITPILGIGLTWEPRLGTRFIASADRRVLNSAAEVDYNYVTSSVAVTGTQRFGDFIQFSVSLGYENADYDQLNASLGPNIAREDNYFVVQGGVTAAFNRHWSASADVTYGKDESRRIDDTDFVQALVQFTYSY